MELDGIMESLVKAILLYWSGKMEKLRLKFKQYTDFIKGYALMRPPTRQDELEFILKNIPKDKRYIEHYTFSEFVEKPELEKYIPSCDTSLKIPKGDLIYWIDIYLEDKVISNPITQLTEAKISKGGKIPPISGKQPSPPIGSNSNIKKYICPECRSPCDGNSAHEFKYWKIDAYNVPFTEFGKCLYVRDKRGGWRRLGDYDG